MKKIASAPGVSIIVCTNRPRYFDQILDNYRRQRYARKELIIILNKDSMNLRKYRFLASGCRDVSVYQVPERISLGQCLNCGISRARFPLMTKFDDDDYYSPYYLTEQVRAFRRTGCDIVGKHACLVYLAAGRKLVIRSPQEKQKHVEFVQGGTLLFTRRLSKQVRFPDRSLGEDVAFLRASRAKGYRVFATSPFNYVYIRRKNKSGHTWKVKDQFYLDKSVPVAVTDDYRVIARRPVR
ncbi:Glycosyltransferase like family 2 [Paenibacillus sp. UNCCL117]|uniref:glycosyltransferase n=1 Tax=unclassified Paenibacillus TaxID=185978 RepID=UPI000890DCD9|nr:MULTISPECIES: glycosyltransferase family A protein [unclassified Paenibacillus]SDC14107.1 Glycosyltransferase like family 2 [Paenibacillus sp. cl123]SFW17227.1 Glycosyltransferase like family 2 [Paenibacillus sp. UNCCL117]